MKTFRIASFATVAAAMLLPTAAIAQDAPIQFEHAGRTYVYTKAGTPERMVISGKSYPSGERFRLVLRGGKVRGDVGGRTVTFRAPEARSAALASVAN